MAALTEAEARSALAGPADELARSYFDVLAIIAMLHSLGDAVTPRELLLRLLERRAEFPDGLLDELRGEEDMLRSLVRELGLYPYIDRIDSLGAADRLAYEIHRPLRMGDVVFHAKQEEAYRLLRDGLSVVLSAPTSFGKSLLIDAVVAAGGHQTIVLIVPTIALIDETRRRLAQRFGEEYTIVTQASQPPGERTIYVLTQERFLDIPEDRFEEFYKLGARGDERSPLLNMAFHRLHATGAQFYLLGPNIHNLTPKVHELLNFEFFKTDGGTVALDTEFLPVTSNMQRAVTAKCRELSGPTILYVSSPDRTRTVAKWLIDAELGHGSRELDDTAKWIADNYHPEWSVARAIRNGIGVHHGKIPRALGHHMVRLFNEGKLRWLIVTSSLIEGVNTAAKNIVLIDRKVGRNDLDFFTYNNIRGRSGRMFHHFVGNVIVFGDPPPPDNTIVDIPAFSQGPNATLSLLVQLPWNELTSVSRARLQPIFRQRDISIKTIRAARGMDPNRMIEIARTLRSDQQYWSGALAWSGEPTYDQLEIACDFIYNLSGSRRTESVRSSRQLAMRIHQFRREQGDIRNLADNQAQFAGSGADKAVDNVLDLIQNWMLYRVPSHLMILQSICEEVFAERDLPSGNYGYFAGQVAALFRPPMTTVLEEYGLPAPLADRLSRFLSLGQSAEHLDEVLEQLRSIPPLPGLNSFEQGILNDVRANL